MLSSRRAKRRRTDGAKSARRHADAKDARTKNNAVVPTSEGRRTDGTQGACRCATREREHAMAQGSAVELTSNTTKSEERRCRHDERRDGGPTTPRAHVGTPTRKTRKTRERRATPLCRRARDA